MLFNKRLLQSHLNSFEFPADYDFERTNKIISNWQTSIKDGNYDKTNEVKVQSSFLTMFFNVILGYEEMHDNPNSWHLENEVKTEIDSTKADGALGYFDKDNSTNIARAVIELKDAKTPLDKKQSTRKDYDSPVSQAFSYSTKFDGCDWIIVSNFKEIRLYHKDRGQGYYVKFEVLDLHEPKEFKRFYFLLCKQNLLDKNKKSLLDELVKDTSKNEEDISKKFYKDFKALRQDLFQHICTHNPDIDKNCLLEKTQKLLDRLIFIMFCEDSATGLLPLHTLKNYYETGKNLPMPNDDKIWQIIKGLFQSIDKGNESIKPPINAYNGGLFATDEILDNLVIKDDIWQKVVELAHYDFESDLNVNILGHIFEQSLSDLEQIKSEIEGVEQDKKKSKRKKDGIFYTPEYITQYIVEQTVGRYLEENPDKIDDIKILDPACGSGAFINQAHTFLRQQHQVRTEEKIASEKTRRSKGQEYVALDLFKHTNVAETDRSILLNNLFGVDLNEESTEITKLALWLKTAKKDQPLQNLDNNIKCGNSLIDDVEIAGNKAFNWNNEFKDIMDDGGFDVIIGNPPYVRQELFSKDKPYLEKTYEVYTGVSDLFVYFFERGLKLLREGGYFSFIVSNKFIKAGYGKKLTQYLQKNYTLVEIIDFGDLQIFEGATTYPCIITIKKQKPAKEQQVSCLKLETLDNVTDLQVEVKTKGFTSSIYDSDEVWSLTNKNIIKLIDKLNKGNISLADYINGKIYYGIKTGFNDAFIINHNDKTNLTENIDNRDIIKPVLRGKDINRYGYHWSNLWIINTHNGYDNFPAINVKDDYPILYSHFENYKDKLQKRADKGQHWSNLRNCAYCKEFESSKIIWGNLSTRASFAYEENSTYLSAPAVFIPTKEKWLVALLNSKVSTYFLKNTAIERQGGYIEQKPVYVKQIPIPKVIPEQQQSLANKAQGMMDLNKEFHEQVQSALNLLQAEYNPAKISKKLEKFYELGANPFLDEMKKQKVNLSLEQKQELLDWYSKTAKKLNDKQNEINTLDNQIDQEVYKLYNLTDEEIEIIETSSN